MEIVVVFLAVILAVLVLANVRVEVVMWTISAAGVAMVGYSAYYDPTAKDQLVALAAFLAFLVLVFYALKYIVKKIFTKINSR